MIPFMRLQNLDGKSRISLVQAQTLAIVAPGLHALAPVEMIEVPANGLAQARLELAARGTPELPADLRRVDRIAAIVPGTIRHERLQTPIARLIRPELVEHVAEPVDDLDVRPLVAAADVVFLAGP